MNCPRDFILFGHRTAGKSSLGRILSERGFEVIDLDCAIETKTGRSAASLVAENWQHFRRLETETLRDLLAQPQAETPRLIVCGAGIEEIPNHVIAVWIDRDGWEESARTERERLRPELSWEEEVEWMRQTREPRYQRWADLKVEIPRGRALERVADELEDLIVWTDSSSMLAPRTFVVPQSQAEVAKAEYLARRLNLAGVEIRSDLETSTSSPYLASLRGSNAEWLLEHLRAEAWDIDIDYFADAMNCGVFETPPRRLILSTHPSALAESTLKHLRDCYEELRPEWKVACEFKVAPQISGISGLAQALALWRGFDSAKASFIPQGSNFVWLRFLKSFQNPLSYMRVGLSEARGNRPGPTPHDLQDLLPIWTLLPDPSFQALLGMPVHKSQGDWWHRRAALSAAQNHGYIKIPCEENEFETLTKVLHELGVHELSITTPLKAMAAKATGAKHPINTLKFRGGTWMGTDTDEAGMRNALSGLPTLEKRAAIVGQGDVSHAVSRSMKSEGWEVELLRGRADTAIGPVPLVINATGRELKRPVFTEVQIDLHYTSMAPSKAAIHLNGDRFFEGQAREQRVYWFQDGI